jgi:hypothetical protein
MLEQLCPAPLKLKMANMMRRCVLDVTTKSCLTTVVEDRLLPCAQVILWEVDYYFQLMLCKVGYYMSYMMVHVYNIIHPDSLCNNVAGGHVFSWSRAVRAHIPVQNKARSFKNAHFTPITT